jgi:hypothetical protein
MGYNERTPAGSADASSATSYPIARALAFTVIGALVILIVLRHLYGSISIEAGAR